MKTCHCDEPCYAWNADKQRHTCIICGGYAPPNFTTIAVTHVIVKQEDECIGCHGRGCNQCADSGIQK